MAANKRRDGFMSYWYTIKDIFESNVDWPDVLIKTKLAKTRSEGKRKIKAGALKILIGDKNA